MAELLLFHHALGLTPGVVGFADTLRAAGHTVHTPDLYEGRTFDVLDEGVAHAREIGFATIADRGVAAAEQLPSALVYGGFSLGAVPAQRLAQTRSGARGALLCYGVGGGPDEFAPGWPADVPVQVHAMDRDPEFANEWDQPAAEAVVAAAADGTLFLYPGEAHLFADASWSDYDAAAAELLTARVLEFLDRV